MMRSIRIALVNLCALASLRLSVRIADMPWAGCQRFGRGSGMERQDAETPGKQHCENYRRPSLPARDLPAGRPVLAQPSASISGSRSLWKRERPDNRSGPFTQARLRTSALTRPQATAPPAPPPVTSSGDTVPTLPLVGSIGLSTHSGSALAKRSKSRGWFGLRTEGLRCGEQLALHPGGEGR